MPINYTANRGPGAGQIALNTMQGLQGMRANRMKMDAFQQDQQRQNEQRQIAQKFGQALQNGDNKAVGTLAAQNPELIKKFSEQVDFQDRLTSRPRIAVSKDILSGRVNPRAGYEQRLIEIEGNGGNAEKLRESLQTKSDEELFTMAENDLALLDNPAWQNYASTQGGQDKGFTLSEGQARFDASGNQIAERPKTINELDRSLKNDKNQFDKAAKIRTEVEKVSKVYRDIEDSYGRIKAASVDEPSGASDMALIFNYMKMLDPGSTVREGEFATAADTGGISDSIVNMYNKARDGQMISPNQRKNFIKQAKRQFDSATKKNEKRMNNFERLGKRYGLQRGDIIISGDGNSKTEASGEVTTQAQFDALPSGAVYLEDGVQYRKP